MAEKLQPCYIKKYEAKMRSTSPWQQLVFYLRKTTSWQSERAAPRKKNYACASMTNMF
jgi:hypothetical protein